MLRAGMLLDVPRPIWLSEAWEVDLTVRAYREVMRSRQSTPVVYRDRFNRVADTLFVPYPLVMGLDSETTGLNKNIDRISLFSYFIPEKITIPLLDIYDEAVTFVVMGGTVGAQDCIESFRCMMEDPNVLKVGANINGYDWFMFRNHTISLAEPLHDTLVMSWAANENRKGHGLKKAMKDFYGYPMQDFKEAGGGSYDVREWPYTAALDYTGQDAWASYMHWKFLFKALNEFVIEEYDDGDFTMFTLYDDFLYPLQQVVRNMMDRGITLDMDYLDQIGPEIKAEIDEIYGWFNKRWHRMQVERKTFYMSEAEQKEREERDRKRRLGRKLKVKVPGIRPINLNSVNHLRYLFFDLLGEKPIELTKPSKKTGMQSPTLKKEVLKEYAEGEYGCTEYAEKLMRFRELDKLYGTYIGDKADDEEDQELFGKTAKKGGLRNKIHRDGRVYTNFKFGPVTGRLASSGPNLMNIPSRTKLGKKIRQAFVAMAGYILIVADYAQLEMRLFAHFSEQGLPEEQQIMCQAIREGRDLHCWTAAMMYGADYADVHIAKLKDDQEWELLEEMYGVTDRILTPQESEFLSLRSAAKAIGFGLLYGMGPFKLSQTLGITYEQAQEYMELFFKAYPGARQWIDQVHADCMDTGIVWTILNRPRRLNEIFSSENWVKARAKRQSVNSIIQGSAADVVLSAMLKCENDPQLSELDCRLLLQVHDELVFEIPEHNVDIGLPRVKELMEYSREGDNLEVDLTVSAHKGNNWRDAK